MKDVFRSPPSVLTLTFFFKIFFFKNLSLVYVYGHRHAVRVEVSGQLVAVGSLLLCGSRRLNSGCQAYWRASFPTEPSLLAPGFCSVFAPDIWLSTFYAVTEVILHCGNYPRKTMCKQLCTPCLELSGKGASCSLQT